MKKIVKASLLASAVASLGVMGASAKTMTADDIIDLSKVEFGGQTSYETVYVYGKNVHINMITMSDLILSGADMEGVTDKSLYYKNGDNVWTKNDGLTEKTVNKSSLPTFEMTRLIGTLSGSHVSEETDLYDGDYVKTEDYTNGRKAEIFVDETAEYSIVDIKPVSSTIDFESPVSNASHTYNNSALTVNFDSKNGALKLNESTPLLEFANKSGNKGEWFGLVIKLNKSINKSDLKSGDAKIVVNLLGTALSESNFDSYITYRENSNELTVWLDGKTTESIDGQKITVKDAKAEKTQEITISYANLETTIIDSVSGLTSEPVITDVTEGVSSLVKKINNDYKIMFYSDKALAKDIKYTINGDAKIISKTDSKVYDLLQLKNVSVANSISSDKKSANYWNQSALDSESISIEPQTGKDYDYIVRLSYTKGLMASASTKGDIALAIDLSANVGSLTNVDDTNKPKAGITGNDEHLVWVKNNEVVTFENANKAQFVDGDSISVKFVLEDNTPEVNVSITPGAATNIYTNPTEKTAPSNVTYINNMSKAKITSEKDEDGNYVVTIQQKEKGADNKFKAFTADGSKFTEAKKYFGIILELDKNPLKTAGEYTITTYEVTQEEITDAKTLGVDSSNAFVVWVAADESEDADFTYTLTIKDNATNKEVTVTFVVKEIADDPVKDKDANGDKVTNVVVDPRYSSEVSYDATRKEFTINNGTTTFVATTTIKDDNVTTTKKYTYTVVEAANSEETCGVGVSAGKCVRKVENLSFNNVYNIEKHGDVAKKEYNMNSVKSITPNFENNSIDIVFNRNLNNEDQGDRYCILLDLGVKNGKDTIKGYAVNNATEVIDSENSAIPAASRDNLVFVCISEKGSNVDNGGTELTFHNTAGTFNSEDLVINVRSEIVNELPNIKLTNARNMILDPTPVGPTIDNLRPNNERIVTKVVDGKVVTTYSKPIDATKNSGKFGIIVDLGIKAEYVNLVTDTEDGNIEFDNKTAANYGATGENEFVIWFKEAAFKDNKAVLEFNQNVDGNTGDRYAKDVEITFVLEDGREPLATPSIVSATENADLKDGVLDQFNLNQTKAQYSFAKKDSKSGILTITREKLSDFQKYPRQSGKAGAPWYIVEVDFGKDVTAAVTGEHHVAEPIEGSTAQRIWINVGYENDTITFTDVETKLTYTLTIDVKDAQ